MHALLLCSMLLGAHHGGHFAVEIDHDQLINKAAIQEPVIIHITGIDEATAQEFDVVMEKAQTTGQSVIPIYISSFGGELYALFQMIDTIKASKVPVATIVVGKAMSAGILLAASGTEGLRFAAPNSTFMIHEVSTEIAGKVAAVAVRMEEAKRVNALMFKLISERTGKPEVFFHNMIEAKGHSDWFMTAEEAKKIGLINKIGIPTFKVVITSRTVLE